MYTQQAFRAAYLRQAADTHGLFCSSHWYKLSTLTEARSSPSMCWLGPGRHPACRTAPLQECWAPACCCRQDPAGLGCRGCQQWGAAGEDRTSRLVLAGSRCVVLCHVMSSRQIGPAYLLGWCQEQVNKAMQRHHSCRFVSLTGSWKTLKAVVAMIQSGVRPMRSATTPWPAACRSNSSSGSTLACTGPQQ